jgi:hypothetical protein
MTKEKFKTYLSEIIEYKDNWKGLSDAIGKLVYSGQLPSRWRR